MFLKVGRAVFPASMAYNCMEIVTHPFVRIENAPKRCFYSIYRNAPMHNLMVALAESIGELNNAPYNYVIKTTHPIYVNWLSMDGSVSWKHNEMQMEVS